MKIKKGDKVKVIAGKDKGKEGSVEKIFLEKAKVTVTGVNVVKRHVKPGKVSKEGGIISMEKPVSVSNVILVCSSCGKTTRVGYKMVGDKKTRICKKCGNAI